MQNHKSLPEGHETLRGKYKINFVRKSQIETLIKYDMNKCLNSTQLYIVYVIS